MDIFNIFSLFGGLALFLYGMSILSSGLEKMTGGKLEKSIAKMTASPLIGLMLGMGITVAIQSSSAFTVMLVGLVNSGVMKCAQTFYMILGSNIGTTLTAWIFSAMGVDSNSFFVQILKPSSFAPIIAFVGVLLIMSSKRRRKKDLGTVFVGFAVLMYGMTLMSDSMTPLQTMPQFENFLVYFNNPLLGVLVGAVFTAVIQSSAASVAILQALSLTGSISWGMAIPIVMGQNIGTCATAIISSFGVKTDAKRIAFIHTIINVSGTIFCLIIYYLVSLLTDMSFLNTPVSPAGIALVHTVFNIVTTAVLFPLPKLLMRITEKVLPEKEQSLGDIFIDERLLDTPSFAISECLNQVRNMAQLAEESFESALSLFSKYDVKRADEIVNFESRLDTYEDKLSSYLVKLSSRNLSYTDSRQVAMLLHMIGDFERIGDHALNLREAACEMSEKKITFSDAAKAELSVLYSAISDILSVTISSFVSNNEALAERVEPFEQLIDNLIMQIKANHILRLQDGNCTIELGFVLADILTNIERTSDHCSNIAVAFIEVKKDCFGSHEYLNAVKTLDNDVFKSAYAEYSAKYQIQK